jgi:hypothetical protein
LAKSEWQKAQSCQQILQSFLWLTAKILYKFHTRMFYEIAFLSFVQKSHTSCKKAVRKLLIKLLPRGRQHGSRICFAAFILSKITNLLITLQPLKLEKEKAEIWNPLKLRISRLTRL